MQIQIADSSEKIAIEQTPTQKSPQHQPTIQSLEKLDSPNDITTQGESGDSAQPHRSR